MSLTKKSARTNRKPCRKCGSVQTYWGVTPEGRFVLVDANDTTRAIPEGGAFPDGFEHALTCGTKTEAAPVPAPEIKTEETETEEPVTIPVVPAATIPAPPADTASALAALIATLTPTVSPESIRAMVREEFASVVFPTKTVVIREGQEAREVEGHTHAKLSDVIRILGTGEHVMMVGPAGTGKSTIAHQAADALNLPAYSLSLSPQTSSATVFGYMQATGDYVRTLFREAYEFGGVFNFDEIDNGHPSILAAINGALANGHAAFPDGMVERSADFRCVASANTYGRGADRKYVGRQALDAATLDRFTMVTIDIDETLERDLCQSTGASTDTVTKVLTYVRKVRANIETHSLPLVVSPRASVGICRLLVADFTFDEAIDMRIRRGLSASEWTKLTAGV